MTDKQFTLKKKILFTLIILITLFLIIEVVARLVENQALPSSANNLQVPPIPPKNADSYRICLYGGSTVYGEPVWEFSFDMQLGYWLEEMHPGKLFEIYNFGASGKSSTYVRQIVEATIQSDPDLLIVLTGHNEFLNRETYGMLQKGLDKLAICRILKSFYVKLQTKLFPLPQNVIMPGCLQTEILPAKRVFRQGETSGFSQTRIKAVKTLCRSGKKRTFMPF